MKLLLERIASNGDSTIGVLYLDGKFFCFACEDEYRVTKVKGRTRIPAGTYKIRLRTEGGLTQKYLAKFPALHRGMLWLQDVTGFQWIYIHIGNKHEDTEGCILVGRGVNSEGMFLYSSTDAYLDLYRTVADAAEAGDLEITIVDRDR